MCGREGLLLILLIDTNSLVFGVALEQVYERILIDGLQGPLRFE